MKNSFFENEILLVLKDKYNIIDYGNRLYKIDFKDKNIKVTGWLDLPLILNNILIVAKSGYIKLECHVPNIKGTPYKGQTVSKIVDFDFITQKLINCNLEKQLNFEL